MTLLETKTLPLVLIPELHNNIGICVEEDKLRIARYNKCHVKEKECWELQLDTYQNCQHQQLAAFLKETVLTQQCSGDTLTLTGKSCDHIKKVLEQEYGKGRIQQENEFLCTTWGLCHLASSVSRQDLVYDTNARAADRSVKCQQMTLHGIAMMSPRLVLQPSDVIDAISYASDETYSSDPSKPMVDSWGEFCPFLMVLCGDSCSFLKVNKDGSHQLVDTTARGVSTWRGISSLLLGVSTIEELAKLAEMGDTRQLDFNLSDISMPKTDGYGDGAEMFKAAEQDDFLFMMSKAVGKSKDDFKKEDLAATLLQYSLYDTMQIVSHVAYLRGVRHVFMCGDIVKHAKVREIMTSLWLRKKTRHEGENKQGGSAKFHLVKPGSYLAAIGLVSHQSVT